jgi:ribosome-associated protein
VADELPIRGGVVIPRRELSWRFSRSGGPGGQSVNTADSRVELRWNVAASNALPGPLKKRALQRLAHRLVDGELVITASEHRAQLQNRRAAETRLVALVAQAIAPSPARRRPTKPTAAAVRARLDAKRRRSRTKELRRTIS